VATGALSPNDVLALEEMNGIGPDGDKHFVSTNLQPLDGPEDGEDDSPAPEMDQPGTPVDMTPEAELPAVADVDEDGD
jgi:hypothetical protein